MADTATKEVEKADVPAPQAASPAEPKDEGVETQKADAAAEPDAPEAEAKAQVDYKAEFERVSKQKEQAEHTIVELKRENKALKRPGDGPAADPAAPGDPEYVTAEELTRTIEANVRAEWEQREAKLRADFTADAVAEELSSLSGDPDERKLIEFHYRNTIRQSGASRPQIREDLRRARLIANESALMAENEELREALRARNSAGRASVATNRDRQPVEDEPRFTPQERQVIQRRADAAGLSFREFVRRHPELKK